MILITNAAQVHFKKLLSSQEDGTQIRVFVTNPGTPHAECGVSYCPQNTVVITDIKLEYDDFWVFLDDLSSPYLEEAEIDFVVDELGSQLTLKAPNAKLKKVSDNAPLLDQVRYIIQSRVNPQLASHGGSVSLVEISSEGYVILKFNGGCNGCSMVSVTLKEGIEKELLESFPMLKGVQDLTQHEHGAHSYY
jgi:Fe/S biogenesis protein NfuA